MTIIKNRIIVCLTLLICVSSNYVQADVQFHVAKSAKSFFVGQEFVYEILVRGAAEVKVNDPDDTEDISLKLIERVVMDQATPPSVAIRYRVLPMKPGMLMFPVFSVVADGQELLTDEEDFIDVGVPEAYPGLAITRQIPNRDLYVGEGVKVDYQWKSPLPLSGFRAVQLHMPLFYDSHFSVRSPHRWIDENDKTAICFPVSNTRLTARYASLDEAGRFFNTVSFAKILTPTKVGEFVIRPATLLTSYVGPPENQKRVRGWKTNYPSYFNNNFFESSEGETYKKYFVASAQQTIRVLPLPDIGKPNGFTGQVGKRRVSVTATPKIVRAGDPITLTIVVDDCEFPELIDLPELEKQVAFTRQFALPVKQSRGRMAEKQKTFIRTLRPRSQDVTFIPAVRLPYFDPQTKAYAVASSQPIPITVKAAETATAFDAKVSGAGPMRNLLAPNPEGIRANFTTAQISSSPRMSKVICIFLVLFLPPLAFVIFYLFTKKQRLLRSDPVRAQANEALKNFNLAIRRVLSSARTSGDASALQALDNALRGYFSDKLNLVRYAHTIDDLKIALGDRVSQESLMTLQSLYSICEADYYQGAQEKSKSADVKQSVKTARQLISIIHPRL